MELLQNVFGIIIPAIGYIIGIFSFFYYNKLRFLYSLIEFLKGKKMLISILFLILMVNLKI